MGRAADCAQAQVNGRSVRTEQFAVNKAAAFVFPYVLPAFRPKDAGDDVYGVVPADANHANGRYAAACGHSGNSVRHKTYLALCICGVSGRSA
jgi:hypothetical protein